MTIYDELAEAVDKSPDAVRQIAHRARSHVAARRPRGDVTLGEARGVFEAFQRAVMTGDLQGLVDVLAPDVVMLGDGGGIKQALPRPIIGVSKVSRLLIGGFGSFGAVTFDHVDVNGRPALIVSLDGEVDSILTVEVAGGLITGVYAVRNPEKLSRVGLETEVRARPSGRCGPARPATRPTRRRTAYASRREATSCRRRRPWARWAARCA